MEGSRGSITDETAPAFKLLRPPSRASRRCPTMLIFGYHLARTDVPMPLDRLTGELCLSSLEAVSASIIANLRDLGPHLLATARSSVSTATLRPPDDQAMRTRFPSRPLPSCRRPAIPSWPNRRTWIMAWPVEIEITLHHHWYQLLLVMPPTILSY